MSSYMVAFSKQPTLGHHCIEFASNLFQIITYFVQDIACISQILPIYGTAQFKLYTRMQVHAYRYTRVLACLTRAKLKKLACAHTVACAFDVRTRDSKHTQHTRDACHKLALGLSHYTCGVTTGTVAVGNEIQLLCS